MAITLAHVSDIHFGGENAEAVAAATAYLRSHPPDLTVVTGDLTLYGAVEEFTAAKSWVAGLPGDLLCTPGNHDTPWADLFARMTAPFERYERAVGRARDGGFAGSGLFTRTVNTARGWQLRLNWSKGEVSPGQVRRTLAGFSRAPPSAIRLLACHHPLLEVPGEPITGGVRGGSAAARALVGAEVDMILSGHLHMPFLEAVPLGDECTYAIGAGTLSLRERGSPPSFNLITIDGDGLAVTVMEWSRGVLMANEPWRRRLRPRRAARGATRHSETAR